MPLGFGAEARRLKEQNEREKVRRAKREVRKNMKTLSLSPEESKLNTRSR
jgi:hypothetical protein